MSENIRRVVGLLQFPPGSQSNGSDAITHSFLVIGNGFQIDNAFYVKAMQLMQLSIHDYIRKRQSQRQLDEDPGTTKLSVFDGDDDIQQMFKFEGVGREKLRLVCTPDEKMEQKLAYETTSGFKPRSHCLKITQNVAFKFWHFSPIFVLLKLTCLVTLFDCKLQFFKNSPN